MVLWFTYHMSLARQTGSKLITSGAKSSRNKTVENTIRTMNYIYTNVYIVYCEKYNRMRPF